MADSTAAVTVTCSGCGASAKAQDASDPHASLQCPCCAEDHDHACRGCRPVIISATACLSGTAG